MSFLEISGLAVRRGGRVVLDGIDLAVDEGAFVALVGPSGSGKTTLLKSINRLIAPDAGTIRLDDADIRATPPAMLRRGVGYVIQSIGLFPHLNVAENIWMVPRLGGAGQSGSKARIAELLDLVALPADFAGRYPHELSGGQAQRVGVARALAAEPRLLLMDEPFGALDPVTREALGSTYRALHDRLGLTTLMVTHDIGEALLLADQIVVLIEGHVRTDTSPRALLGGAGDADVQALIAVPKAQAARLAALGA